MPVRDAIEALASVTNFRGDTAAEATVREYLDESEAAPSEND